MPAINFKLSKSYEPVSDYQEIPLYKGHSFLKHQVDTYQALKTNDIVLNLANTGSGKTNASFLHLLDLKPHESALIIAPTNAILDQHQKDVEEFSEFYHLNKRVISLSAENIKKDMENSDTSETVKGKFLYRNLGTDPCIAVSNPDIFYYGLFFLFGEMSNRNISELFMSKFSYLVIDELHYYTPKQLAFFLYFMILMKELGFFSQGFKTTILTATPLPQVTKFLKRMEYAGLKISYIDPYKETNISQKRIISLTECNVSIQPMGCFSSGVEEIIHLKKDISNLIKNNKDGVIIVDSRRAADNIYHGISSSFPKGYCRRITGVISKKDRQEASKAPIIIATPTVDIGYNFASREKSRQNIDFVIMGANTIDSLLQRLGRAGRILGKKEQDIPSQAVVFVLEPIFAKLFSSRLNNQTITRQEFKKILNDNVSDMNKKFHDIYISRWSLSEMMFHLSKLEQHSPNYPEILALYKKIFETVKTIFSPHSPKKFKDVLLNIKKVTKAKQVVDKIFSNKQIFISDVIFLNEKKEEIPEDDLQNIINSVNKKDKYIQFLLLDCLYNEIIKEYQVVFSFRENNIGTTIEVISNNNLLGETDGVYSTNILNVIRDYEYQKTIKNGKIIFEITNIRNKGRKICLELNNSNSFQNLSNIVKNKTGKFITLWEIELSVFEKGLSNALERELKKAIYDHPIGGVLLDTLEYSQCKAHKFGENNKLQSYPLIIKGFNEKDRFFFYPGESGLTLLSYKEYLLNKESAGDF